MFSIKRMFENNIELGKTIYPIKYSALLPTITTSSAITGSHCDKASILVATPINESLHFNLPPIPKAPQGIIIPAVCIYNAGIMLGDIYP